MALNRDRHIPDGNFLDEEALRKMVVDLKSQQMGLMEEQRGLEDKVTSHEISAGELKQRYNIIGAAAEIYGWDVASSDAQIDMSPDEIKWEEMNHKLEVQTLSDYIRKNLPRLEAEALRLEADIFAINGGLGREER